MGRILDATSDEGAILKQGGAALRRLCKTESWLPPDMAQPSPERYQQYLLHLDAFCRFSVVSFVWAGGQSTPIHNHRTWGLVGVLHGLEASQRYEPGRDGRLAPAGPPSVGHPGNVEAISVQEGDIHQVSNALEKETTISIHAYGGNIGSIARSTFTVDGRASGFVSGYTAVLDPARLWPPDVKVTRRRR